MSELDRYFSKYNTICKKIFIKELELEALKEKTIGAINYSEKTSQSSPKNKGLEIRSIQIENLEERIKKLYSQKEKRREKHIEDFKKFTKTDYEIIMIGYYLDRLTLKNLSIKLDKSIGHIKKIKREAIKELLAMKEEKEEKK